ncbi:hypothetical protein BM43_3038 [Burkholderia gladioli]|uniref:Transcriptional regulator n=1 Tax=Burkholderia gladioli TaxID=28095 RepID=A0AAW3EP18_BURGA|nr:hypothetical protein [Burkholderia gladioli]AJW98025.1 hypothetical protein BM43_3038 [Burkholderia gladioli]ASD79009.1 hypothetical protein CEJ98_08300 [Burkholderia gladioli pv. gladioli]AWY55748.1 hypothetical protein A8H28_32850 [Burkholderia gladioli pv. gladioli]KGC09119.1 hypothetical protein DM48_5858 [Burkholderia gladioli]KGC09483.1 hypothetical protein DM48_5806 [Burkholderia gladioli]
MTRRPTFEQVQARRRERAAARNFRELMKEAAEAELAHRLRGDFPVIGHPQLSSFPWIPFR